MAIPGITGSSKGSPLAESGNLALQTRPAALNKPSASSDDILGRAPAFSQRKPYDNGQQAHLTDRHRSYLASPILTPRLSEVGAVGARTLQVLKELSLSFSERNPETPQNVSEER